MKIEIKDFNVTMELGNNGITFDVRDPKGNFLGDIRIGKAKIEWCKGKTKAGNGKHVSWLRLIDLLEQHGT